MTCHVARRMGEFERRLGRDRLAASRALVGTDAEIESLQQHHPGEFVDDAASEATRRLLLRLEARERRLLAEIDAAEARLSAGSYGVCEACGRPIAFARLLAMPTARLCLRCRQAAERPTRC